MLVRVLNQSFQHAQILELEDTPPFQEKVVNSESDQNKTPSGALALWSHWWLRGEEKTPEITSSAKPEEWEHWTSSLETEHQLQLVQTKWQIKSILTEGGRREINEEIWNYSTVTVWTIRTGNIFNIPALRFPNLMITCNCSAEITSVSSI